MRTQRIGIGSITTVLGLLATMAFAMPVFAVDIIDDPMQIDERATQLIQTSNLLCWEMHRYHQQQPNYRESYRAAKELWSQAGQLRDALRASPVETEVLMRRCTEMNEIFAQLENTVSKWGPGDTSLAAAGPGPRTVVNPGVVVDIPFVGVRVGGSQVVVDDGSPQLDRRRIHQNARGSKRSLEREMAAVKVALSYLLEDAGVTPNAPPAGSPTLASPVPQAPAPAPGLGDPQEVVPPSPKKPDAVRK